MKLHYKPILSLAFALIATTSAQLTYRDEPTVQWDAHIQSIRAGNGVFLSPSNNELVATSYLGHVYAFNPRDGSDLWHFTPTGTGMEFLFCTSGVTFATHALDYIVYTILINDGGLDPTMTRVIALSLSSGAKLWESDNLVGLSSGTPVVSDNGRYIFLTHNSGAGTVGHFSILDGHTGEVFHTQNNPAAPFAPIGIHHKPIEGHYGGGQFNGNDMLAWSVQPKPSDTSVGPGATYAFQFPIGFNGDANGLTYTRLESEAHGTGILDFQAIQKPVFANDGLSMYWGTSRSQFRCWIGEIGKQRYYFSRPRTTTVGYSRGTPPMQAVFAPLAKSHDAPLLLFGGTASNEFVRLTEDFSGDALIATTGLVKTEARVSPDDAYVYYVEFNGRLHKASTDDLMDTWVEDMGVAVEGEFALNRDGTLLFITDVAGSTKALRVGDVPTDAPSSSPTPFPTAAPTANPTDTPTLRPSRNPSNAETPFAGEPFDPVSSGTAPHVAISLGLMMIAFAFA